MTVDQRERRIAAGFLVAGLLAIGVGVNVGYSTKSGVLQVAVGLLLVLLAAVQYARHR